MGQQKEAFAKRGLGIAALSYDSVEALRFFAERVKLRYPLLSDPQSKVIRAFGILNEAIASNNTYFGMPNPGTYIVDQQGIVQAKFFEKDYRERNTAANMVVRYFNDASNLPNTVATTKHLKLTYRASDAEVRPLSRVALVVEVELKPDMHVYSPEVEGGYIPISWNIASSPGWTAYEVSYPKSKKLHLPAIDETVPVYDGNVKLVRDLTIGSLKDVQPLLKDGELTVEGSFRYQACDDKMCYRPEAVPLRWTFRVVDHDRQRVPQEMRRK